MRRKLLRSAVPTRSARLPRRASVAIALPSLPAAQLRQTPSAPQWTAQNTTGATAHPTHRTRRRLQAIVAAVCRANSRSRIGECQSTTQPRIQTTAYQTAKSCRASGPTTRRYVLLRRQIKGSMAQNAIDKRQNVVPQIWCSLQDCERDLHQKGLVDHIGYNRASLDFPKEYQALARMSSSSGSRAGRSRGPRQSRCSCGLGWRSPDEGARSTAPSRVEIEGWLVKHAFPLFIYYIITV